MKIRMASVNDAQEILNIYAWYVKNTTSTFEFDVPSYAEFAQRIEGILERYPYLVAVEDERIVGYAYASFFNRRAAAITSAEISVYLEHTSQGRGIGRALYERLESILKRQNVYTLYADISSSNRGSIAFHERCGYTHAAHLHNSGYKKGQWLGLVWMEKELTAPLGAPQRFIPITELRECLNL